jgi:antitoxin component YwqK of YwqJK toxin-antitoxin module
MSGFNDIEKKEFLNKDNYKDLVKKYGILIKKCFYNNDKLNGSYYEYVKDKNNEKESYYKKCNYVNNELEGSYEEHYSMRKVKCLYNYQNGELHGKCKKWNFDGYILEDCEYFNGNFFKGFNIM